MHLSSAEFTTTTEIGSIQRRDRVDNQQRKSTHALSANDSTKKGKKSYLDSAIIPPA